MIGDLRIRREELPRSSTSTKKRGQGPWIHDLVEMEIFQSTNLFQTSSQLNQLAYLFSLYLSTLLSVYCFEIPLAQLDLILIA